MRRVSEYDYEIVGAFVIGMAPKMLLMVASNLSPGSSGIWSSFSFELITIPKIMRLSCTTVLRPLKLLAQQVPQSTLR